MKLSDMREILGARGIRLTKSLGQSFLHDQNQLRRIAAAGELTRRDKILEIGPGLGPLTELLLAQAGHVLAIEKDARLVEVLAERFAAATSLDLLHADALDIVRDRSRDWHHWKLVANLPYSVASPILVELAQNPRPPERFVATLQLEVARRLMARPGDEEYGLLTLLVQLRYEPRNWFKVPRGCFFPEPDVDSACVALARRERPLLSEHLHETFTRVVRRAFSQRRKTMFKLLKQDWPDATLTTAFAQLGIEPHTRGEALGLDQFVTLTRALAQPDSERE